MAARKSLVISPHVGCTGGLLGHAGSAGVRDKPLGL
jgi:hypothetical protein